MKNISIGVSVCLLVNIFIWGISYLGGLDITHRHEELGITAAIGLVIGIPLGVIAWALLEDIGS